jgi:hypothetical protein
MMHITHKYWSPWLWCHVVLLEDINILKENVTSNYKTDDVVRVDWQVTGRWSIRYVWERKEAQHSLRQLEKWEKKSYKWLFFLRAIMYCHRGDRVFLQNVYLQDYTMSQSTVPKSEQLCHKNLNIYIIRLLSCLTYNLLAVNAVWQCRILKPHNKMYYTLTHSKYSILCTASYGNNNIFFGAVVHIRTTLLASTSWLYQLISDLNNLVWIIQLSTVKYFKCTVRH